MKRHSLIILFLIGSVKINAQYWAKDSSKWYIGIVESFFSAAQGYTKAEVTGDTLLQGHSCKVIHKTRYYSNGLVNNAADDYMYGDNGKVYHYMNNTFYTLYNFNAMPGDTWTVAVPFASPFCMSSLNLCDSLVRIIVDSVSTITIQSQMLKTLYVHSDSNDWYFLNPIIENIGSVGGFFPYIYNWFDFDIPYLRCYQDTLISYQTNFSVTAPCDSLISSIENITDANYVNVFPNPVTGKFNIKVESSQPSEIIIYDMASRKILQQNFINTVSLNTEQLAKGLYLYEVRDKNGLCKKGKIVKD